MKLNCIKLSQHTEAYSEHCQTSKMEEPFPKIVSK